LHPGDPRIRVILPKKDTPEYKFQIGERVILHDKRYKTAVPVTIIFASGGRFSVVAYEPVRDEMDYYLGRGITVRIVDAVKGGFEKINVTAASPVNVNNLAEISIEEQLRSYIQEGDYVPVFQYFFGLHKYPEENIPELLFRSQKKRYQDLWVYPEKSIIQIIQDIEKEVVEELRETRGIVGSGQAYAQWDFVQRQTVGNAQAYLDAYFPKRYGLPYSFSLKDIVIFTTDFNTPNHNCPIQGKLVIKYVIPKNIDAIAYLTGIIIHEALHKALPYSIIDFFAVKNLNEGFITSETSELESEINQNGGRVDTIEVKFKIYVHNLCLYNMFKRIVGRDNILKTIMSGDASFIIRELGGYGVEVLRLLEYIQLTKDDLYRYASSFDTLATHSSVSVLEIRNLPLELLKFIENEEEMLRIERPDWEKRNKAGTVFDSSFKIRLSTAASPLQPQADAPTAQEQASSPIANRLSQTVENNKPQVRYAIRNTRYELTTSYKLVPTSQPLGALVVNRVRIVSLALNKDYLRVNVFIWEVTRITPERIVNFIIVPREDTPRLLELVWVYCRSPP